MNKICCNCGATATCEHHIVPISCGGFDIASNKAPLCDKCHDIVHGISTNKGNLSHSDLIKEGMKKKKESLEKGELYHPRGKGPSSSPIGRPKLTKEDIPDLFKQEYFSKQYLNISDLARRCNMSRTTVYKYISILEENN
jgi:hypothetical protein